MCAKDHLTSHPSNSSRPHAFRPLSTSVLYSWETSVLASGCRATLTVCLGLPMWVLLLELREWGAIQYLHHLLGRWLESVTLTVPLPTFTDVETAHISHCHCPPVSTCHDFYIAPNVCLIDSISDFRSHAGTVTPRRTQVSLLSLYYSNKLCITKKYLAKLLKAVFQRHIHYKSWRLISELCIGILRVRLP